MNHGSFDKNRIDWVEFDRLVDGQLDDFEYRELLHRIEEHPEGWRRCAMAFLEHQALQRELGELAEGSEPLFAYGDEEDLASENKQDVGDVVTHDSISGSKRGFRGHISALITMSACILVGLAIGNTATDGFRDSIRAPASGTALSKDDMNQVNHAQPEERHNSCPVGLSARNGLRNADSIVPTR